MTNDRANLVHPKPLGDEVADGLASGIVKVEAGNGGAIIDGGIPSASEQNVELRAYADRLDAAACATRAVNGLDAKPSIMPPASSSRP